jgi:hypothetical protein
MPCNGPHRATETCATYQPGFTGDDPAGLYRRRSGRALQATIRPGLQATNQPNRRLGRPRGRTSCSCFWTARPPPLAASSGLPPPLSSSRQHRSKASSHVRARTRRECAAYSWLPPLRPSGLPPPPSKPHVCKSRSWQPMVVCACVLRPCVKRAADTAQQPTCSRRQAANNMRATDNIRATDDLQRTT